MKYDVITIGGGPAGIMSAIRAGESGARVLLVEKNKSLGVKLLLTGHGRCNLTNNIASPRMMAEKYGSKGKFLLSAFSRFGVLQTIDFFEQRGVLTVVEAGGKVFPKSSRAQDVLNALLADLKKYKVAIKTGVSVKEIIKKGNKIEKIVLADSEELSADKYIVAVGGKSYPLTGSVGDGYAWLQKLGHTIVAPRPVLSPIETEEKFVKEMEGASLSGIEITIMADNKKIASEIGEAIFTSNGLSGPMIINLSRFVSEALAQKKKLFLKIDFVPTLDFSSLNKKLESDLQKSGGVMLKNYLSGFLPPKMVLAFLYVAKIRPEKKCREITRDERKNLTHLLKEFTLKIKAVGGYDRAMATAGGVDLKEVDPKTMGSKIISNLYLAGEVLDLDGPTGGYNLQVAWSTGYVAGESVVD